MDDDPAIALFFRVTIDTVSLGTFASCKGLSFEVEVERVREGGQNGFLHVLPGRITYGNVTFTRAVNAQSQNLAAWFASMNGAVPRGIKAEIEVMGGPGPDAKAIATWVLSDVVPVRWSGPDLDAGSGQVAVETFEIAHGGFLDNRS